MTKEQKQALFASTRMHSELVYNMTKLEGNPYTYSEVKTLLDGITVGGRKLSDQEQVLRVSRAWEELRSQISQNTFTLTKANFIHFNKIIAENEALMVGSFRLGQVYIAGVEKYVPPKAEELDRTFEQMMAEFQRLDLDLHGKAFWLFLQCARYQFFYDGNKRTAQLMMNGFLLSHGLPVVSIPARLKRSYDSKMTRFYDTNKMEPMMKFLRKLAETKRYE
ncbi:Fic family protein [Actinobacillus porcinus]|uniref:Fic family protein n=1 Tax=Actinobacillus porcinus TaxID=51048 RepID=UPI002A915A06|nr:Fic family protein [Actinobacillus porcinus]MDY5848272.1 Fic family protein [Actinobacillus porcinus]